MLAVRRGGVDSVRQLVASMFLMETQVADVVVMVIMMILVLVIVMVMVVMVVIAYVINVICVSICVLRWSASPHLVATTRKQQACCPTMFT